MANSALPRPNMPGPQPVEEKKVTAAAEHEPSPLLRASSGDIPDHIFKATMTLCGLAVLGVLGLIVWQLVWRSELSWHAFGFSFLKTSEWDPPHQQFGSKPFIFGTVVSSIVALIIAVPLAVGVAVFTTEMCPKF